MVLAYDRGDTNSYSNKEMAESFWLSRAYTFTFLSLREKMKQVFKYAQ